MDDTPEQIPQTIGRYQVQESVGYGAMGAVYKAFDPLIKRTLAIKTIRLDIPRQSPQYKSFIERFYHEARISGTLSHPNIVTLYDIGEEAGVPYLAMEFVEGETLSSILERGVRFPPEKVIGLISQIASAVDYAHSKGVIHRDIKPSNLILYDDERVKVTDFGIAKLVDAEITHSGTLLGTPSYMSPEQAMGDKLDGRSDIFSLGVCVFEMLSGEQPFPGTNVTSILYRLVHVDPIEPANLEMNGLVPHKWHEVFGKVLAKRPDDRYQTATDFVQDLEYCLGAWFGAIGEDTLTDAAAAAGHSRAVAASSDPDLASLVGPGPGPGSVAAAAQARTAERSDEGIPPAFPQGSPPQTVALNTPATVLTGATVLMGSAPERGGGGTDATIRATPSPFTEKAPAPTQKAPVAPTLKQPAPSSEAPTRKGAPAAPRMRPRVSGVVLGIAALLSFAAVSLGMVALYRRLAPPAALSPAPPPTIEAAAPTPEATVPPATAGGGAVHVESDPPGATVTVNGEPRGVTPLDLTGLTLGNYDVKVELKGYEPRTQGVILTGTAPRSEMKLALSRLAAAMGAADILSNPFGATVTVDGKAIGYTPLTNWKLKQGAHKVQIEKDGHEPWSTTVVVQPGKRARIDAQLKTAGWATPQPTAEAVDPAKVYEVSEVDARPKRIAGEWAAGPKLRSGETISVSGSFVVTENGEVTDVRVTESGGKTLDETVMAAIRKWKYAPATRRGVKVKVRLPFKQTFTTG